ncbi:DUF2017 domain-containing protein [Actinocrinis puniceicyclus]|uniref:DUF2017 domain-containing protein n=1 Tax=Actinocrinis puniceicyclus TaxID=977794 RepID=A0A8J8BFB0_9ACTN|nr:DUF2017 domain-containing protein [Actinocrinis puniceicyclus]MBS2964569.1 DUF2017 domain-containing protein [Actinocrinis puniceicyclus]
MIAAFTRGPDGTVLVDLRAAEARLLTDLFGDLLELLTEQSPAAPRPDEGDPLAAQLGLDGLGDDTPPARPDDPALARLFPDAYPDDPDATAEFRRYTQADLTTERRRRATLALQSLERIKGGGRLSLAPGEATAWLGALNDLRLVLGIRLEITADDQEPGQDFGPGDPRTAYVPVYYYLGFLQETLVEALSG